VTPSILVFRLNRVAMTRMIAAGSIWGLTLSAGFFLNALFQCGMPCPDDIVIVTAACIVTGVMTIGPLAAFAPHRCESAQILFRATGFSAALKSLLYLTRAVRR